MSDIRWWHTARGGAAKLLVLLSQCLVLASSAEGWRHVVDFKGVRGTAIGGGSGNTVYAGLGSGDVFRSDDNGLSWTRINDGLVDAAGGMLLPKAFFVTPTGRVIRAGDNASWQNKVGSPIFVSDDRGAAWREVPLPFASSARNPAGIAASDGVAHQGALYFSDLLSEGVWKSVDNGATWKASGESLPTAPFVGFVKTYYAIASAGDALLTVEGARGVFRSTDGGATWAQAVTGISGVANSPLVGGRTWTAQDVVGAPDGTAFAVVDSRLYRSRDAGASWVEVADGLIVSPNPFVPSVIQPAVRKVELLGDRVFVSSTDGNPRFFEGTALGESWTELPRIPVGGETASVLGQSFAAHNGALYFAGTNGIHRLDLATAERVPILPLVVTAPAGPFGVNVGSTLRVTATTRGTAPFTYEWRIDGVPIAGQTGPVLNFTAGGGATGGALSLVVRNAAGSVTNVVGALSIAPAAPGVIDYGFAPQTPSGGGVTAMGFGPDGSVYYAGSLSSQFEQYAGVRKASADGVVDTSFITGSLLGGGSGPGITAGVPRFVFPLGDGSVLVGASGTSSGARYYRRLLANGAADLEWPWPDQIAGGPRKMLRLPGGKLLIAGGSDGGIRRLNADGTFDPSFQGPTSIGRFQQNYVADMAVLPDGRILIAGRFDNVDGVSRVGIARLLPDGPLDRDWIPASLPSGSEVNALAVLADGRILLGGAFVTVGGTPHRNLVRLNVDGTVDTALGDIIPATTPAGVVNAFAIQPDGRVWVGGAFVGVSGRDSLFRLNLDGTVDGSFPDIRLRDRGGASPVPVLSLAWTQDGRLWIGSAASEAGGVAAGQLFRIRTDVEGPTLGYVGYDETPDPGSSLTLRGTVTGPFTALQWRFNGVPVAGANAREFLLSSVSEANSGLYDLVVVSAGGSYTSAPVRVRVRGPVVLDQQPAPVVAVVTGTASFAVTAFGKLPLHYQWLSNAVTLSAATNRTLTLTNLSLGSSAEYAVRVTAGDGSSTTSDPAFLTVVPIPGVAQTNFQPRLFATTTFTVFKDIAFLPDGRVVVSGNFALTQGGPNAGLARLTPEGEVDPAFKFESAGLTEFLAVERQSDGKLVVLVRGARDYLVRRLMEDGSVDPSYAEGTVSYGEDLQLAPDGGVLVAGSGGLTRFTAAGVLDTGFQQRANLVGAAQSVSVDPSGRIYVTGIFAVPGSATRVNWVRLLADGTPDATFVNTQVFSSQWRVTALPDGALVGDLDGFYRFDESGRRDPGYAFGSRLAVWDLTAAGGLAGVLANTLGDGVLRRADGTGDLPVSTMKVPGSSYGYSFLRVAPDGALWLAFAGSGARTDPKLVLYRLNGPVSPLALVTSPLSRTVDSGARVVLTAAATGTSRVTYQWLRNGRVLTGETNTTLVIEAATPADGGDYTVQVGNRSGSLVSRPATLLVLGRPEILGLRGGGTVELGDSLVLAVTARGVAPMTFQWRHQGVPLANATQDTFVARAARLSDAGSYDVVITNPLGSVASEALTVAVSRRPGAVIASFAGASAGGGMEINVLPGGDFLVDDKAYTRFGELSFRLPFPDGTSTVLRDRIAVDAARQRIFAGPTRRVRAYGLDGALIAGYAGPNANVRRVRVESAGTVLQTTEGVTLPFQRLDASGAIDATFTPAVSPSLDAWPLADGRMLALTFGQRTVGGRIVYNTILDRLLADGTRDPSFVRVTNAFPQGGQANRLHLDRNGRILVLGGTGTADATRIVRLEADGTPDATFAPAVINGEITAVAEQLNGRLVIVGGFRQVDGQPRSLIARLHADGSHDTSFQPGSGLTTSGGQNIAHDVDLLPAGEIVVTGTFTHANGQPRNGVALFTGDSQDLYFTREPKAAVVRLGGSVELVTEATGTSAVSYQWQKDGVAIAGQTGAILVLAAATAETAGEYRVLIRNASGEMPSRIARVDVVVPPVILESPRSTVTSVGSNVVFSVTATGLQLSYQWRFGGAPLADATNTTLSITGAGASSAGRYSVVVSNPAGSVTSAEAQLRVRPALAPPAGIPTDGIVGEVLFEGNFSERSRRFPTTLKGNPTLVPGIDGGQAGSFTAGTDWLQLGTGTARLGGSAYSASFWIWPEGTGSINVYSLTMFVGAQGLEHYLYLGGDDNAVQGQRVFLGTRGLTSVHSSDDRAYVPKLVGRWTHVVVAYRGSGPSQAANYTVYIDGEAIPLVNSANTVAGSGGGNGIGRYGPAATFRLDDFRIYGRAIEAGEVARLHHTGPAVAKPEITRQPAGGSAAAGGAFTLSVEASGAGLFYEWYRGEMLLSEEDGPSLVLAGMTAEDAGSYRVVISNAGGSVTSVPVTVQVSASVDAFAAWAAAAGLSGDRAQPGADADGDGVSNLAEFVHGSSPVAAQERPEFRVTVVPVNGAEHPALEFVRRAQPGGARVEVQVADSILFEGAESGVVVSASPMAGGLERVVLRGSKPVGPRTSQFFRILVRRE